MTLLIALTLISAHFSFAGEVNGGPNTVTIWERDQSQKPKNCIKDMKKFMTTARIVPHLDTNSNVDGFEILELAPDHLLKKLGLMVSDIVISVNDKPIKTGNDTVFWIDGLRKESQNIFILKRGDQLLTLKKDCPIQ